MISRRAVSGLWLLALLGWGLAARGWRRASSHAAAHAAAPVPSIAESGAATWRPRVDAETVVARDPFRLSRRPADVPFAAAGADVPAEQPATPLPLPPAIPALRLAGIVGGGFRKAVIEGVPGRDGGVVVRPGDTLGGLSVRAIGRDSIVVRFTSESADSTWAIGLRPPWQ